MVFLPHIVPRPALQPYVQHYLLMHVNVKGLPARHRIKPVPGTSAYAEFEEQSKGSLTFGKVADLAVLSQDIFTVAVPALMKTQSLLTMVNGNVVYDANVISWK